MSKRQSGGCRVCVGECTPDHAEETATCDQCGSTLTRYGVDGFWFDTAYSCPKAPTPRGLHAPKRQSGRDWRAMTRDEFDGTPGTLFDLQPAQVAADDGHGTGDLLTLT